MTVYNYLDYKEFLRDRCRSDISSRGFQSQLAKAAGCQPPFISRMLKTSVHITPDHACGMAQYLGLDELETEYFLNLVDHDRAGSQRLRSLLRKRLDLLRRKASDLGKRLKQPSIDDPQAQAKFYSSWRYGAIHIIVSISEYQSTNAIARRLSLSEQTVLEILRNLKTMGLVDQENGRWILTAGNIHISRNSPLNAVNHQNWRTLAVQDSQKQGSDGIHYSIVFSMSKNDVERFRAMTLKFIDDQRKLMEPSPSEDLVCFTCDFFRL